MRNVKVGMKILLGFIGVILMIAIILVLTFVTSMTRGNDLEAVMYLNQMQREANNMLDDFNLARVEIRVVFTTVNNDSEYQLALEYLDNSSSRVATLDTILEELETETGYTSELISALPSVNRQLEEHFQQLDSALQQVNANDSSILGTIDNLNADAAGMITSLTSMLDMANTVIQSTADTNPGAVAGYIDNLLKPLQSAQLMIEDMRILNRDLILNQDTSVVPEVYGMIDDIQALLTQTRNAATTDAGRQGFDDLMGSIENYRSGIAEMVATIESSDITIESARALFLEVSSVINEGVDGLTAEASTLIETTTATSDFVMWLMLGVALAAVAIAFLVAFYLSKLITKPLGLMKDILVKVGTTGNLTFTDDEKNAVRKEAETKDELGESLRAFVAMMDQQVYIGDIMTQIANNDLTADVNTLSGEDTMGLALEKMVGNLNHMFAEINSVASQVATASSEVATGAQQLAQGSTEQASTVEEISASISEITEQATISVQTAGGAADESQRIRDIAQQGNEKMGRLSTAVQEMSDASHSIGNVIKVIDDIAFQTNILALNAAVEAARAGEHGKGFAVVADEVRNLAGKSAEAAKETAGLISANIEKSEEGMNISQETAETLLQIVEGVEHTTESLTQIAEQSEGAKAATQQVNLAVDQVAQVVQQNSATSEESAAASEEMSSQAQVLQQLIAEFKLKDSFSGRSTPHALPEYHGTQSTDIVSSDNNTIIF